MAKNENQRSNSVKGDFTKRNTAKKSDCLFRNNRFGKNTKTGQNS